MEQVYAAHSFWEIPEGNTLVLTDKAVYEEDLPFGFAVLSSASGFNIYLNIERLLRRLNASVNFKKFLISTFFTPLQEGNTEAYIPMTEISKLLTLGYKGYMERAALEPEDVVQAEYTHTFSSWNTLCDHILGYTELMITPETSKEIH